MKKNVQNLMKCKKTKNQRRGFLRTTALMMTFMLLIGSADVSVFAAQDDNNAKVQEANIQLEENADNTAADSTAVVQEKKDDTLSDEDAELKEADSEKESEETLAPEESSDINKELDFEEKDDPQMESENEKESILEKDSDIKNLQEKINELPTVEEVQSMNIAERSSVYEIAQELSDEYEKLSETEQKLVDVDKLEKLFEYFNSQISVMADYSYDPNKNYAVYDDNAGLTVTFTLTSGLQELLDWVIFLFDPEQFKNVGYDKDTHKLADSANMSFESAAYAFSTGQGGESYNQTNKVLAVTAATSAADLIKSQKTLKEVWNEKDWVVVLGPHHKWSGNPYYNCDYYIGTQQSIKLHAVKIIKKDKTIQYYDSLDEAIKAGEAGDEIIVASEADTEPTITENVTLKENVKLTIPEGKTVTMKENASLSVKGELDNGGTLAVNSGASINNSGLISGAGSIANKGDVTNSETGIFKTSVANESSGTFTNEANSSWKESGSDKTYYGPLDAALKETQGKTADITLENNATISGDKTLGGNVSLNVPGDKTLTISDNGSLAISDKGSLNVEGSVKVSEKGGITNNGTLDITEKGEMSNAGAITGSGNIANKGTVVNEKTGAILSGVKSSETGNVINENDSQWTVTGEDGKIFYGSLDGALDNTQGKTADITLENDATISGDKTLGGNVSLKVPGDKTLTISDNGSLAISDKGSLNVEGSVKVSEMGGITNNGTLDITEKGNMSNAGAITGSGNIANKGTVVNEKTGAILSGVTSTDKGTVENRNNSHWTVNGQEDKIYYGSLDTALDEAKDKNEKTDITLDKNAELSDNKEIGSNVSVTVPKDKTLTIPENKVLTVSKDGQLKMDGSLQVKQDAELKNNGNVSVDENGSITNAGKITGDTSATIKNEGQIYNNSTGTILSDIDTDKSKNPDADVKNFNEASWTVTDKKTGNQQTYYGSLSDVANAANQKSEEKTETGDKKYDSVIRIDTDTKLNNDITLKDGVDLVVPDGTTVTVPENTKLTISEGASLDNKGTLDIKNTGALEVEGTLKVDETGNISNNGELSGTGDVKNKGSIVNDKNGTVKADKLENVDNGTFKNQNDVSLTDKEGKVYYYSSLDEALKDAKSMEGEVTIDIGSRVNPTISGNPEDATVVIPENVTIVIPENKQLTIASGTELEVRGKIENKGTILNGGALTLIPESNLSGTGTLNNLSGASWKNTDKDMAYYGPFKDAVEKAGEQGTSEAKTDIEITLEKDIEITEDVTIPENVTVTIPKDKSLTVQAPASLNVFGKLNNCGNLQLVGNASLNIKGEFNNNGNFSSEAQWKDENGEIHYGLLKDALASGAKNIELKKDVTLTEDTVIPEDVKVSIKDGATITVPKDKSLEIKGTLEGADENTVINQNEAHWGDPVTGNAYYGSLDEVLKKANEKATAENRATVVIDHNTTLKSGMNFDNINLDVNEEAEISIENGVSVPEDVVNKIEKNNECIWTDKNGTHYGSLENALKNQTSGTIKVNKNAEIKSDITIASDVTLEVSKDKTITVAKDATMTINGKIQNNGTIKTMGEMTITGALENTGMLKNEGTMNVSGNVTNQGTIANLKDININENSSINNASGAKIKGSGSIKNNGNISNQGEISVEGTVAGNGEATGESINKNLETTLAKDHVYGSWIIDEAATATQEGRRHRTCTTHGEIVYQTIPATGTGTDTSSGKTYKEVLQKQGAFDTNLNNPKQELVDGLLNDGEKEDIDTFGSSAYIWLEVAPNAVVSTDDKKVIEKTAKTLGDNVGIEYNEISLYKRVGFEQEQKITDTNDVEISITIDIPVKMTEYDKDKIARKFYMLRAHEGEGTVIDNGVLSDDGTQYTFKTTKFSTYALAYVDSEKTSGGSGSVTPVQPGKPGTSENPDKTDDAGKPGTSEKPGKADNTGKPEGGASTGSNNNSNVSGDNASDSNGGNQTNGTGTSIESQNGSNGTAIVGKTNVSVDKKNDKKSSDVKADGSEENGKTSEQIASATDDSKKDNHSNESGSDSSKDSNDVEKADGNTISVKADQSCLWHWIIAVIALIGIVLALLARKRKYAVVIAAIDTVLMLIGVILGSCRWDIVTMLIGVVLLVVAAMIRIRRTSRTAR